MKYRNLDSLQRIISIYETRSRRRPFTEAEIVTFIDLVNQERQLLRKLSPPMNHGHIAKEMAA